MRIKYSIRNKNSFKVFNDSMGVALNRENIIRSRKVKYLSYLSISILELVISLAFLILMILLNYFMYCFLSVVLTTFATLLFIFMIINILYPLLFTTCCVLRYENELEINEDGISFFFDDDNCITVGWTHIRAMVIGKYSLNFITDSSYYFYLDKKYRKEVTEAIKKYNESLLVISRS